MNAVKNLLDYIDDAGDGAYVVDVTFHDCPGGYRSEKFEQLIAAAKAELSTAVATIPICYRSAGIHAIDCRCPPDAAGGRS